MTYVTKMQPFLWEGGVIIDVILENLVPNCYTPIFGSLWVQNANYRCKFAA